ncbi:hypothetical protein ACIRP7_19100 [Streptomyces sp. NPDC102270]|uniref:hypothetical protein n=1 Tax=Streptomyces sp. NPDC102270 TaxID=3366150 RepID=UPI0037F21A2F
MCTGPTPPDGPDPRSTVPPARRAPRTTRTLTAVTAVALLLAVTSGCGDAGDLVGAGSTPTAISPDRLWPQLTPASSPAFEIGEVDSEVVAGVPVPGDDIRTVDPVALVRAEIKEDPGSYAGGGYVATARRMADCGKKGAAGKRCPVLWPYYRDLTGDGREDLTLGFRQLPGNVTAVRVYTVEKHRLVRVMHWEDAVSGVELAGRSVIIRSPSEVAGYEYRLQWTWDPQQKSMLLTHDEMLRTGSRALGDAPSPVPGPSASSR